MANRSVTAVDMTGDSMVRSGVLLALGLADRPGGVDEPDVAEGLREVAEQLAGLGIDLLGEESEVVAEPGGGAECFLRLVDLAGQRLRFGQPEGAQQERSLVAFEPVVGQVPIDQTPVV